MFGRESDVLRCFDWITRVLPCRIALGKVKDFRIPSDSCRAQALEQMLEVVLVAVFDRRLPGRFIIYGISDLWREREQSTVPNADLALVQTDVQQID